MVSSVGFEPTTPVSQIQCSDQTELRREMDMDKNWLQRQESNLRNPEYEPGVDTNPLCHDWGDYRELNPNTKSHNLVRCHYAIVSIKNTIGSCVLDSN